MISAQLPSGAISDAQPTSFWMCSTLAPEVQPVLSENSTADLVIVGGGLTGLWAAIEAKISDPSRDVILLEGERIAFGASGRNGGFFSESLTHGLSHGLALWPSESETLLRLGRENVSEIMEFLSTEGIDADMRMCGKSVMALREHHLPQLRLSHDELIAHGESATLLNATQTQDDIHSPTYMGSLRHHAGGGLLNPAKFCWGLKDSALNRGVRIYEMTTVKGLENQGHGISVETEHAKVITKQVILATNAFTPLLRKMRNMAIPVFDHVLVTEQLTPEQISSLGWSQNQGVTDSGNQFHYYRRTPDNRLLWGGYDALYYFGSNRSAGTEEHASSHELLARQFYQTFPQLDEIRFTHKWAGMIDATTRFTPAFGTSMSGKVAYSFGYTGLGVASSRFGARVALDLLSGVRNERTELSLVRNRPIPFPSEPIRYALVQISRAALAKEDSKGQRGWWLKTLDRLGVGFNS